MKLAVITPVIHPARVPEVARQVAGVLPHPWELEHRLCYGALSAAWLGRLVRSARADWLLILPDDARLPPELPRRLHTLQETDTHASAFRFGDLVALWWYMAESAPVPAAGLGAWFQQLDGGPLGPIEVVS